MTTMRKRTLGSVVCIKGIELKIDQVKSGKENIFSIDIEARLTEEGEKLIRGKSKNLFVSFELSGLSIHDNDQNALTIDGDYLLKRNTPLLAFPSDAGLSIKVRGVRVDGVMRLSDGFRVSFSLRPKLCEAAKQCFDARYVGNTWLTELRS